jgi:hypothetical protein
MCAAGPAAAAAAAAAAAVDVCCWWWQNVHHLRGRLQCCAFGYICAGEVLVVSQAISTAAW